MNGLRPTNRLGACFGKSQKSYFARAPELCHRTNRFLDRCLGIDAMLIIKIDHVNTQPAQTRLARFADVIRMAADPSVVGPGGVTHDSKLCSDDHMFTMSA